MKVSLFKTLSPSNSIEKELTDEEILEGTFKTSGSVVFSKIQEQQTIPNSLTIPTIFIQHDNPSEYNYVHIHDFNRYYFVNDIKNIRNNLWELNLEVDVLYTYKDELYGLQGIIIKQYEPSKSNEYINDGSLRHDVKQTVQTINFENGFNETGEYILITAGSE